MLTKSRVGRKMDTSRLGQSMARPGMDTRTWVSLAVALGESVVDPKTGVYVDVQLIPTGEKYTARLGAIYAGNSFGLYAIIHQGDELLIAAPGGDPAEGLVVVQRLWTGADVPPANAQQAPDELLLTVEPDKKLRIQVTGQGELHLECATKVVMNTPNVEIGDVKNNAGQVKVLDGSKSVTIYEALEAFWNNTVKPKFDAFDAHVHPTGMGPSSVPNPTVGLPSMDTAAKSTKVLIPNG